jgi:transcriptional regulator with XRE-family HTH domain
VKDGKDQSAFLRYDKLSDKMVQTNRYREDVLMSENNSARASLLGDLIRQARLRAGRSLRQCAKVINITTEEFKQAEKGEYLISLPDLEALAIYLGIPMGYFWGTESLEDAFTQVDFQNLSSCANSGSRKDARKKSWQRRLALTDKKSGSMRPAASPYRICTWSSWANSWGFLSSTS